MLEKNIKDILCKVRDNAAEKGITATISLHREKSHLMRIGNNSVSLNTSEELTRLDIKVINGKKEGTHTQMGNILSEEYVQQALNLAVNKAEVAKDKDYQPLKDIIEENISEYDQYDEALEFLDPAFKLEGYQKIFNKAGNHYNFSGSWSSGSSEVYLISTENKNEAYHKCTDQLFNIVLKEPAKKWELSFNQTGWKKSDFSAEKIIEGFNLLLPVYEKNEGYQVEPGDYTVVFGAQAVGEVLMMAVYTGMSGRMWEEKQGWTANNEPGDMILGENITITDNPADDNTFKFGFDFSGKIRKNFPLVEKGKLGGLMYDSGSAAKFGKDRTGHDLGNTGIVLKAGDGPECPLEAVKDMGKVLYIPALHYINLPNYSKGIFTGSSRFNALLIEDGKVVSPIFSSRITDTFQNVFKNVKTLSSTAVSINLSNTYGRRSPVATSVPSYIVAEGVKITDCAESF